MDNSYLVRLRPYDPRRGNVLRRYTFKGIKISEDRGWYRVTKEVADYLRGVHQIPHDENSPLAFDICTPEEAQAIDAKEHEVANPRKGADADIQLSVPRQDEKPGTRREQGKGRGR